MSSSLALVGQPCARLPRHRSRRAPTTRVDRAHRRWNVNLELRSSSGPDPTARSPSPDGCLSLPSRARPAADLTAPRQPQRPLTLLACRGAGAVPRGARRHPARGATRRVDARFVRSGAWAGAPCSSCARQAVGGPPLLLRAHLSRYSLPHPPPPSPGLASEQFFPTITRAV